MTKKCNLGIKMRSYTSDAHSKSVDHFNLSKSEILPTGLSFVPLFASPCLIKPQADLLNVSALSIDFYKVHLFVIFFYYSLSLLNLA